MTSKLATKNWSEALREIEEQLSDAEALCVMGSDENDDLYRLVFKAAVENPENPHQKEIIIYEDYDLKNMEDTKRLARNLYAILGEIHVPIHDWGEGFSFQPKETSKPGVPVLVQIIECSRVFPMIEVLCRRLVRLPSES